MNAIPETAADRIAKQRSLILLAGISYAIRMIYSAAVYLQNTGNAGWIEAIGGFLACLPALFLLQAITRNEIEHDQKAGWLKKAVCLILIPFFSFDASSWVFALAESPSYTSFAEESLYVLYIPALVTVTIISSRGANACGGLARGLRAPIIGMLLLALVWQIDQMHPIWLTPVLGTGIAPIARGSALCGGYAALYPAGIWLFLQEDAGTAEAQIRRKICRCLPEATLAAVLFLLCYGMLTPNMPDAPHIRSFAMERLLTGGGRNTSVHFPSLLSWYAMLLITAVYSMFCTSTALKLLFPARSLLFCACISAVLCLLWTPVRMFWKHGEDLLVFSNVVVITLVLLLLYLQTKRRKRRSGYANR